MVSITCNSFDAQKREIFGLPSLDSLGISRAVSLQGASQDRLAIAPSTMATMGKLVDATRMHMDAPNPGVPIWWDLDLGGGDFQWLELIVDHKNL